MWTRCFSTSLRSLSRLGLFEVDFNMAIDDPIDAVRQQLANEERASDPVLARLANLMSNLSASLPMEPVSQVVGGISTAFLSHLQADRLAKMDLLINTIIEEFRRLEKKVDEIAKESAVEMTAQFERWIPLVVDGLRRAERTRANDRIERMGVILSNSFLSAGVIDSDNVEEMMRIAMELSNRDIHFLQALVSVQGEQVEMRGRIERFQAWMGWPNGFWGDRIDPEIDSVFAKLESFGLVVRLAPPNNLNISADFQNRYALLRKGLEFVRFARQR
jgi:hypothetical protein